VLAAVAVVNSLATMLGGADVFGVVSGALGLLGTAASLWRVLGPAHRLRALDAAIGACSGLLASIREDALPIDGALTARAHERVFL
jgi:hypothetical protein